MKHKTLMIASGQLNYIQLLQLIGQIVAIFCTASSDILGPSLEMDLFPELELI